VPLLAVIPWLSDKQWRYYRERNYLEVNVHQPDLKLVKAYQDLALNLKVQRNISGNNAIVVSSLFRTAGGSVILSNLAYCLAQSGDSVLLVDANLHSPHLHESFNHLLSYENGLTELINDISEMLYYSKNLDPADLQTRIASAAIPSGVHPQLHYLNAGLQMQNTFEFLNSKGFSTLIAAAKTHYQWVLLDAPPFLEHPDAAVLLSYTDGLLLLTEREATEDQMLLVHDKVQRLNANIIGAVLRGGSFSK
jgi:Mrp family chromosome partitioning ATPase